LNGVRTLIVESTSSKPSRNGGKKFAVEPFFIRAGVVRDVDTTDA